MEIVEMNVKFYLSIYAISGSMKGRIEKYREK